MWVENNWDHKFLAWEQDSVIQLISQASARYNNAGQWDEEQAFFEESIVIVPFNPTAENMAEHLVKVIGPQQLAGTGVDLVSVRIEETAKCSASFHT